MAFEVRLIVEELPRFIEAPLGSSKPETSVRGINEVLVFGIGIVWVEYRDRDIQTLIRPKDMALVKMILTDRLDDVHVFSVVENHDFVSTVDEQDYEEEEAADCAHSRRQHILASLHPNVERVAKLVLIQQHLLAAAAANLSRRFRTAFTIHFPFKL